jgi:WD40 repeat protein
MPTCPRSFVVVSPTIPLPPGLPFFQLPECDLKTGVLASSLLLPTDEGGSLWAGFFDGTLRRWTQLEECRATGAEPDVIITCGSPVLAAAHCSQLGIVAAATASGAVELYNETDGAPRGVWQAVPLGGGAEEIRARAVSFVADEATGGWSVFVGGSDGSIHRRGLLGPLSSAAAANRTSSNAADGSPTSLFGQAASELLPSHRGSVVALTPGPSGLLVSGAHDGTVRVWDVALNQPQCLYGLGGYKVWLGSVCTDGKRLVSDGSDNSLVMHDFSTERLKRDER